MSTRWFLLLLIFFVCSCTTGLAPGGSGTETTTGVTGLIVNVQGSPMSNVQVQLLPSQYDPVRDSGHKLITRTTDSHGRYLFTGIDSGNYYLQAVHMSSHTMARIGAVTVAGDTEVAVTGTLEQPGTVIVDVPEGTEAVTSRYVYIPGTSNYSMVQNGHNFVSLDSVPAGRIPEITLGTSGEKSGAAIRYDVEVASGDTELVQNPSWAFSRKIHLNTSSTGANVSGTVTNFPLLVRLNKDRFNFSEARSDGLDVRFSKENGKFLTSEVERWDSVVQQAEVWVKVDTIYADDSSHYITMYWGNASVEKSSNDSAVFDTSAGFSGVWHMNESPQGEFVSIADYTIHKYDAVPYGGFTADNSVSGVIGNALHFDGMDDYLNAGNVSLTGNYTIGLWVKVDTLGLYSRFIYKDSSYTLWYDKDSVSVRMENMNTSLKWRGLLQNGGTRVPVTNNNWYYITATWDGSVIRLYSNGLEMTNVTLVNTATNINIKDLWFGRSRNDFFKGSMDEIRIENVVRSPDWIRLCYNNQRIDDKLVQFK